jgi:hypothetical protein
MRRTDGWLRRAALPAGLAAILATVLGIPAASAAAAHPPKPAVLTLRASKTQLTSPGGAITITTTVRRARTCAFSSRPAVRGFAARVSCAHGHASRTVRLPANHGAAVISYRFAVSASGTAGTSRPRYATVRVLPAAPAVTLAASPAGLTKAGGSATLVATVSRSASCELSASPAVAGLPAAVPCVAGSTSATVHRTVMLPALSGSAAQPYSFTLKATGPGGSAAATATETVWPAMTFSAPGPADLPQSYPGSLSCGSATNCVATDLFGNAVTWNGKSWSAPRQVLQLPGGATTGMFTSVSCPSATFCMAVSSADGSALDVSGTWSAGPALTMNASSVSCASADFCAAIDGDYASVYTGASWSAPALVSESSDTLQSVSCADATTFCVATDYDGNAYTYSGSGWSAPTAFDSDTLPGPVVSCATQDFCVAVDGSPDAAAGSAFTYNGVSWSPAVSVVTGAGLSSVSCPATGSCFATGTNNQLYALQNGTWSDLANGENYDVTCWSSSACAFLDPRGQVEMMSGTSWTSAYTGLQVAGFPTSVSCPTRTYCAAVDQLGAVAVYNGSRWSVTPGVSDGAALISISCPSPTFCAAVDNATTVEGSYEYFMQDGGWTGGGIVGLYLTSVSCTSDKFCMFLGALNDGVYAMYWNGTTFSARTLIDSSPADGQVSCASPDFCAVVDANGNAMTFNGSSWSAPDPIDAGVLQPLATVSCPSVGWCTAMDGYGQAFTYTGSGWSGPAGAEADAGVTSVSCTSSSFCAAADLSGNVVTEYNGVWSGPQNIDPQSPNEFYGFTGISCATVAFCAAVDFDGNGSLGTG